MDLLLSVWIGYLSSEVYSKHRLAVNFLDCSKNVKRHGLLAEERRYGAFRPPEVPFYNIFNRAAPHNLNVSQELEKNGRCRKGLSVLY